MRKAKRDAVPYSKYACPWRMLGAATLCRLCDAGG